MNRPFQATAIAALVALVSLSSCVASSRYEFYSSSSEAGHLLGTVDAGNGEVKSYRLYYGSGGQPTVNRTTQRLYQVARLGVDVRSIDASLAEELGTEAWNGIYVDYVADDSAAAVAGVVEGDVLLELGGTKLTNRDQFIEVVQGDLVPGTDVELVVSHLEAGGERTRNAIQVSPGSRDVEETETNTIAVAGSSELEQRTGMQLANIPADLALEIWSEETPRCYVSGVQVGSPAYLAGLRGGDQLMQYADEDVDNFEPILEGLQSGDEALAVAVTGPLGDHSSPVSVVKSLDSRKGFSIPLIIDYSSTMQRTKTSFLDIIFQFGFNYKRTYEASSSRSVSKRSFLSILPLGMFEFERTPSTTRNTLFWFITWKTRH